MEARSLASLNALAANPPQYPEKPNEEKQEFLVLYISRVPGTRDIILSPFKLQVKNVTAEDVAASLYYLHHEAPSSNFSSIFAHETQRSSEDASSPHTIPRKPLPDSARPLTPESLPGGNRPWPPPGPLDDHDRASLRRRDCEATVAYSKEEALQPYDGPGFGLGADSGFQPQLPRLKTSVPVRKPVKPQNGSPTSAVKKSSPPRTGKPPAVLEEAGGAGGYQYAVGRVPASYPLISHQQGRRSYLASGAPYILTLIRHDPSSGNQWNVGRVSSRQPDISGATDANQEVSSADQGAPASSACPQIDIEIETSGYARFRHLPRTKSPDGGLEAMLAVATEVTPRGSVGIFSRQVVMKYSRSWTATLKERLGRIELAGRPKAGHDRTASEVSIQTPAVWVVSGPEERSGMKPRGYVFTSPWGGNCEFRTGHGGRSVQCRHTLHDKGPAVYNPLVAQHETGAPRPGTSTVSELRFNLPTSELLLGDQTKNATDHWRGNFNKLLRPGHGHEDNEDEVVSPFSVNVGSERAGGGNRGSRAKLGKLIVHNDGLKMLDLVVAANMGVWWGA